MSFELLIVEDNVAEAIYAQTAAAKAGFRDFTVATTLGDALQQLERKPSFVASDLFFPLGNLSLEKHVQEIIPAYNSFESQRYKTDIEGLMVVRRAVEAWAELYDTTVEKVVEEIFPQVKMDSKIIAASRDAVYGTRDYDQYLRFKDIKTKMQSGEEFPSGIILCKRAEELEIPAYVVTSTYHHDIAFEPIRHLLQAPYTDNLHEGKEQWDVAMKYFREKV